jgi:hypothetical protein
VTNYPASPREYDDLIAYLAAVAREHHPAIARMMFQELDTCPACSEAIRPCDPRRLRGDDLHHLGCREG